MRPPSFSLFELLAGVCIVAFMFCYFSSSGVHTVYVWTYEYEDGAIPHNGPYWVAPASDETSDFDKAIKYFNKSTSEFLQDRVSNTNVVYVAGGWDPVTGAQKWNHMARWCGRLLFVGDFDSNVRRVVLTPKTTKVVVVPAFLIKWLDYIVIGALLFVFSMTVWIRRMPKKRKAQDEPVTSRD